MSFAKRKDANTSIIKQAVLDCGWLYIDAHGFGDGFPDVIAVKQIGLVYISVYIEIKTLDGHFTKSQTKFYKKYPDLVIICITRQDVIDGLAFHEREIRTINEQ